MLVGAARHAGWRSAPCWLAQRAMLVGTACPCWLARRARGMLARAETCKLHSIIEMCNFTLNICTTTCRPRSRGPQTRESDDDPTQR
jgi:hypothetical protein